MYKVQAHKLNINKLHQRLSREERRRKEKRELGAKRNGVEKYVLGPHTGATGPAFFSLVSCLALVHRQEPPESDLHCDELPRPDRLGRPHDQGNPSIHVVIHDV